MIDKKQKFITLCNKLIKLYSETFDKDISVEDIMDPDKFKGIYRDLAKVHHADKGAVGEKMALLNNLRDDLGSFLNDSNFISSFMSENGKNDTNLNKYRIEIVNRLKGLRDKYKEISEIFEYEVENFELFVLYANSNAEITRMYSNCVDELNIKLQKERYAIEKVSELRSFVDKRNTENVQLFNKFRKEIKNCYNIGDVAELYAQYETILKKNAFGFVLSDSLGRLCTGYNDEQLMRYIDEAVREVKLIDYNDSTNKCADEFMKIYVCYANKISVRRKNLECYEILDNLMKSCKNANYEGIYIDELLKCNSVESAEIIFKSLKETIDSRITYSNRVAARIKGFLNKCKRDPENSYTYPFIYEKVSALFNYYDPVDKNLSRFTKVLETIEKEIIKQRENDQDRATNKKENLRNKFKRDFEEGIFLQDGQKFLGYSLEQISTFGGFADYENKVIRMELPRVVANVGNSLIELEERLSAEKNIDNKKDRLNFLKKAISLIKMFALICKQTKDYSAIKLSNSTVVDYRTFSRMVQTLKNIDYINCTIEELTDQFAIINEFLYGDDYDYVLENMVNKRK